MTTVWILIVISLFIITITFIEQKEKTKRTEMKLQAMLREDEMRAGFAPGTYSSPGREYSEAGTKTAERKISHEELQKGMKDLEERLRNLDTIMKNRKYKE